MRKSSGSHENFIRNSWQSQETVLRQPLDGHEEVDNSTSVVIPDRHVCSCLFARRPHTDLRVDTRPWLAFQTKGHGKKSHEKIMRKSKESHEKVMRKSWESHEKVMRKSWESHETVMRQSVDSHDSVMKQSWDMRQSLTLLQLQALQTCLFLSVC